MEAGEAAQVGSWAIGGVGAFAKPGDSWGVVSQCADSFLYYFIVLLNYGSLGENTGLLQVAVGYGARGVVKANKGILGGWRESMAPKDWGLTWGKENTTHARFGSVAGADDDGVLGDDLGKARGALAKAGGKSLEVINVAPEVKAHLDPVLVGMLEAMLEDRKEPG